jgi:hypothetical protein
VENHGLTVNLGEGLARESGGIEPGGDDDDGVRSIPGRNREHGES